MVNARTSRWRRRRSETLVAEVPETGVRARDRFDDEPLWQALRELPARQRAVIVLRYYESLSEAEIAATMGVLDRDGEESGGPGDDHPARHLLAQDDADVAGGESMIDDDDARPRPDSTAG